MGMEISRTTASGRRFTAAAIAASPSLTLPTTPHPSADRTPLTHSSISPWLSAKRTRIFDRVSPPGSHTKYKHRLGREVLVFPRHAKLERGHSSRMLKKPRIL